MERAAETYAMVDMFGNPCSTANSDGLCTFQKEAVVKIEAQSAFCCLPRSTSNAHAIALVVSRKDDGLADSNLLVWLGSARTGQPLRRLPLAQCRISAWSEGGDARLEVLQINSSPRAPAKPVGKPLTLEFSDASMMEEWYQALCTAREGLFGYGPRVREYPGVTMNLPWQRTATSWDMIGSAFTPGGAVLMEGNFVVHGVKPDKEMKTIEVVSNHKGKFGKELKLAATAKAYVHENKAYLASIKVEVKENQPKIDAVRMVDLEVLSVSGGSVTRWVETAEVNTNLQKELEGKFLRPSRKPLLEAALQLKAFQTLDMVVHYKGETEQGIFALTVAANEVSSEDLHLRKSANPPPSPVVGWANLPTPSFPLPKS